MLSLQEKHMGQQLAEKIHKRIDQLRSADSVEMMIQSRIGRCHPLMGKSRKISMHWIWSILIV